jgi:hypothetical protein
MKNWTHKSVIKLIDESNEDPIYEMQRRARELVLRGLESGWQGPPFNAIELAR